jgi:hypothetical protein
MTGSSSAAYVPYDILCAANIFGSSLVLISLFLSHKSGISCYTYLLYYLYATIFLEGVFTIPFIYKESDGLCQTIENFEAYVSLMNILVIGMLVEAHCSYIIGESVVFQENVMKYGHYVLFGFPMIVFFGNINNTYEVPEVSFCAAPVHLQNILSLFIYYIWIWMILLFCVVRSVYTLIYILRIDKSLAKRFFSSIIIYIIVSLFCWTTRTVFLVPYRNTDTDDSDDNPQMDSIYFACYGPIQASGILFSLLYLKERRGIKIFESYNSGAGGELERDLSFSWDLIIAENAVRLTEMTSRSTSLPKPQSSSSDPQDRFNPLNEIFRPSTSPHQLKRKEIV